jgi:hypothetical protein
MIDVKEAVCNIGNCGYPSQSALKQHRKGGAKRVEIAQDGPHQKKQPN